MATFHNWRVIGDKPTARREPVYPWRTAMIRCCQITTMFVCLSALAPGCTSARRATGTTFATPWGMTFEAGKHIAAPGFFLQLRHNRLRADGSQPEICVDKRFSAQHIISFLAEAHENALLEPGELSAIYSPSANRVYFAFHSRGALRWYGHEVNATGPNDRLVLTN
jgi:hypothetical protein